MEIKTFDTHKHIKALQATGFDETQAEVIVKSLLESREYDFSQLATREQVNNLEKSIREQIIGLEKRTSEKIVGLEKRTSEKIVGLEKRTTEQINNLDKQIKNLEKNINDKLILFNDTLNVKIKSSCQEVQNNIIKWVVPLIAIQMLAVFYKIFFS